MKNSKKTKKALIFSLCSILLSIIMLIGSTFAWFTDTQESGKNRIVAGNLDVELFHSNKNIDRELVTGTTELFNVDLWEPGVIAYENFEVLNAGELSLRYKFSMAIGGFNTVVGTDKSLSDVLKVTLIPGGFYDGTREDITKLTFDKTLKDFDKEGTLNIKNDTDKFAVVVYWEPTDEDNEYNLNNERTSSDGNPLFIDLGINLVATQNSYELDSFGSDYDDVSNYIEVAQADELFETVKNLTEDDAIALTSDITIDKPIPQSPNGTTKIDLKGHTLESTVEASTTLASNQTMIIKNGRLKMTNSKISYATLVVESNSNLTLENVEYTTENGAGIFPRGDAASVNIINSTISTYGIPINTNANSVDNYNVEINIKNSTINGHKDGAGTALLVNIPCIVNIENSAINGYLHGVVIRGGTATIKNSTITNRTTKNENQYEHYFDTRNWSQGNAVNLAALTIGNKSPSSYQYPSEVTLINTKIETGTLEDGAVMYPTIYIIGNEQENLGATLNYDSKSVVGDIIRGNDHVTINATE